MNPSPVGARRHHPGARRHDLQRAPFALAKRRRQSRIALRQSSDIRLK
jgi:hypothetical protein